MTSIPGGISSGDQVTLIVTSGKLFVYINDVLATTITTDLVPTVPLQAGCGVYNGNNVQCTVSVDLISIKKFKQI